MWSGPRTVSTALMRAWENRPDTIVVDEPLYAFYLATTGLDHPGRDEVIASQPTDWRIVLRGLAEDPLPAGVAIYYQKHMTHHLLPAVDRAALAPLRHAFLIRDPRSLLASYARVRSAPRCSIPRTCWPRRRRRCAPCAPPSACRFPPRCSAGRPARATPMACGRRTGTTACAARPASSRCQPPSLAPPPAWTRRLSRCLTTACPTTRSSGKTRYSFRT